MSVFSLGPHMGEGVSELCGVSFTTALIPFMRAPPHDLITSQRPHLLISSHWRLGSNIRIWGVWVDTNFQSVPHLAIQGAEWEPGWVWVLLSWESSVQGVLISSLPLYGLQTTSLTFSAAVTIFCFTKFLSQIILNLTLKDYLRNLYFLLFYLTIHLYFIWNAWAFQDIVPQQGIFLYVRKIYENFPLTFIWINLF